MLGKVKLSGLLIGALLVTNFLRAQTNPNQPNILLIIADDLGVDVLNGFHTNNLQPYTPILDSLRNAGIAFKNVWATPQCAPTRAAIMSGKFGSKTGVTEVPATLDTIHTSIFKALANATSNAYANTLIGKWHLTQGNNNLNAPSTHGIEHYEGSFRGSIGNYYNWTKTNNNGTQETIAEYATSHFTDDAIDWINNQNQPWFLWLAHVAPHTPFHIPPNNLYSISNTNGNRNKYYAAVEALDTEIGRLINNIPQNQLDNTLIIFLGDNGTPNQVITNFAEGKGRLFEGGIKVPLKSANQ